MEQAAAIQPATNKRKPASKRKETFTFAAPQAHRVELLGAFTGWEEQPVQMKRQKNGLWKATVSLEPGTHEYRLKVDGQWCDDPDCPDRQPNAFGGHNCVRIVS
jgi:1,4-alpha-glucan branching enzyme